MRTGRCGCPTSPTGPPPGCSATADPAGRGLRRADPTVDFAPVLPGSATVRSARPPGAPAGPGPGRSPECGENAGELLDLGRAGEVGQADEHGVHPLAASSR